jgi:nucleotide-binding universal stress UspA family protein
MNILIATDGTLDPDRAADAAARWYTKGDTVTVFTAMNVPTTFLRGMGDTRVKNAAQIAHEAGRTLGAGDRAAERLIGALPARPIRQPDLPVVSSLANTAVARTKLIVDALAERGITAKARWWPTEYRTARTVIGAVKALDTDLVIIGSHGHGRYEGKLGSTGTKLVRNVPASVLVLRDPTRDLETEEE